MTVTVTDALVVGAGAVGLACAHQLRAAGLTVHLVDQGAPGAATSWGNCGLIEPSHADPLTQPAAWRTALTTAWRRDAPLRIPLPRRWHRARWLARFAAHCRAGHRAYARSARLALLEASRDELETMLAAGGIDAAYERAGMLTLYRSSEAFATHRAVHDLLDVGYRAFEGAELGAVPAPLGPAVRAAILTDCDGHLDPGRLTAGLAAGLGAQGVVIERAHVGGLLLAGGRVVGATVAGREHRAHHVVLAAGACSPALARTVGLRLPIEPARGLSITWPRPAEGHRHPIYFYERKVVLTPWPHGFRIGSTLEFCGFDEVIPEHRLRPLLTTPGEYLAQVPSLARDDAVPWVGFRPMTVDELPIIGPSSRLPGLIYACGHGQLGVSLSAGTGRLVADLLTGRPPIVDPRPFRPRRFGA